MAGTPHVPGTVVNAADLNDRVKIYDRITAAVDVASSVAETTLYSKAVGAGHMSTDRMLRLTLLGDFLHNAGAGDTVTVNGKFGGTSFVADTSNLGGTANANRQPWRMVFEIANLGAANSQYVSLQADLGNAAGTASTGIGDLAVTGPAPGLLGISTLGTIDTTAAQTILVSVQWSASSASNSFRRRYAVLELL